MLPIGGNTLPMDCHDCNGHVQTLQAPKKPIQLLQDRICQAITCSRVAIVPNVKSGNTRDQMEYILPPAIPGLTVKFLFC